MGVIVGYAGPIWRTSRRGWLLPIIMGVSIGFTFYDGIEAIIRQWHASEEYSHGYLIPLISGFLVWQKRDQLARLQFSGSWTGWLVCLAGIGLYFLGELSTLYIIIQYALIITLVGVVLAFTGWQGMRILWAPLFFLIFMFPLPAFLYNNVSQQLQIISSELGVAIIRLFGISVSLEGNMIDLGKIKLHVVEACNGLRYLFPLISFGFICAYFFQAPIWQRLLVFFSTTPIAVLMNSLRIGVIGVLVEHWGKEQAEGFLHDFEGWVIFMICTFLLLAEIGVLTRFRQDKRSFRELFGIELPASLPKNAEIRYRSAPLSYIACSAVLLAAALSSYYLIEERAEVIPKRSSFAEFPHGLGDWEGTREALDPQFQDTLKHTDYLLANYQNPASDQVNLYISYYESQRKGQAVHTPQSCVPGSGWMIQRLSSQLLDGITMAGSPLIANRMEIQKGDHKQLVYYWFPQRGRLLTNMYLIKGYLFWDALTRNRSDGALVRLVTPLKPGEDWSDADGRLHAFAKIAVPALQAYIPD